MTLYQILNVPPDTPPEMVGAASLVTGGDGNADARAVAAAALGDPDARADYDARAGRGLAFELALAWGCAALAEGAFANAREHFQRAARMAPEDHAAAALSSAMEGLPDGGAPDLSDDQRAAAVPEIERLRNNSAFPHRLIRYAEALAADDGDDEMVMGAARELLQYDIAEAPRAYAMTLPVVKDHYRAVYALDAPFFDASLSILTGHTPRAEYERGKAKRKESAEDYSLSDLIGPAGRSGPEGRSARRPERREPEPPRRSPGMGLSLPGPWPSPGPAWVGAVVGGLFGLRLGPAGIIRGAIFGFLIAYAILVYQHRRR